MYLHDRKRAHSQAFSLAPGHLDYADSGPNAGRYPTFHPLAPVAFNAYGFTQENMPPPFQNYTGPLATPNPPDPMIPYMLPDQRYPQQDGRPPVVYPSLFNAALAAYARQQLQQYGNQPETLVRTHQDFINSSNGYGIPGMISSAAPSGMLGQNAPIPGPYQFASSDLIGTYMAPPPVPGTVIQNSLNVNMNVNQNRFATRHPPRIVDQDPPPLMGRLERSPSGLNFQTLTLRDGQGQIPRAMTPPQVPKMNRATAGTIPTAKLMSTYPNLPPNSVLIIFDAATQKSVQPLEVVKSASQFFATKLHIPIKDDETPWLRLRDDFPPAIHALLSFIHTRSYTFNTAHLSQFPHATPLDLHIHAYLAGEKYGIQWLCIHAGAQYLDAISSILDMDFLTPTDDDDGALMAMAVVQVHPRDPQDHTPAAEMDRLLDSLVLLFRNTPKDDPLRAKTLEVLLPHISRLVKVRFFGVVVGNMKELEDALVEALKEDGFDVRVVRTADGAVKFGGEYKERKVVGLRRPQHGAGIKIPGAYVKVSGADVKAQPRADIKLQPGDAK